MRSLARAQYSALVLVAIAVAGGASIAPPAAMAADSLAVVLNEVFYDPAGADAGYQFVELVNRSEQTVALAGWRVEAGDGAGPGRWRALWTGAPTDVIPPRGRFVLGEANVAPVPDRVLAVELENGPDAVRLVAPHGAADVLGYGPLTHAEYFEGRPAEDAPSGFSLGRWPDGHDSDDNAADIRTFSPPTPGRANRPERDVAWSRARLVAERLEPGDRVSVEGVLVNQGIGPLAVSEVAIKLWAAPRAAWGDHDDPGIADSLAASTLLADGLEPGDSVRVALGFVPPGPGAWDVRLAADILDDGLAGNDRVLLRAQVGPGPLIVNEIASVPSAGPEWIEVANLAAYPVALEGWSLEDATGRRAIAAAPGAAGFAFRVDPESLVVLTADPAAVLALYPELPRDRVAAFAPWPALNNTAGEEGPADRIVLRDGNARASDEVALPGGDPPGSSRERRARRRASRDPANWGLAGRNGGTPGRENTIAGGPVAPGVELTVNPRRAAPREGAQVVVRYRTGFDSARVSIVVYDVRGRPVRTLLDGAEVGGSGGVAWDAEDDGGRIVAPGLYVVGLDATARGGAARVLERAWLEVR